MHLPHGRDRCFVQTKTGPTCYLHVADFSIGANRHQYIDSRFSFGACCALRVFRPQASIWTRQAQALGFGYFLIVGCFFNHRCRRWNDRALQIAWATRDKKIRSAVLQRYWTQRQLGFTTQKKGKVAILRIDAFTQTLALDFSKALPAALEDAEAIVLDLRFNGGGDAEAMADVASLFLADGINLGRFADRSGAAFELQTYSKRVWRVPQLTKIKLPLVVLTSESTSSAAEIMVAALQAGQRARVIGTTTCGCVLAIRTRHALPDGGLLDVSEFDYRTAHGVRLQDRGVSPDQTVRVSRSDLYSRRDPALDAAKKFLKR